jgi:hypothetical protein
MGVGTILCSPTPLFGEAIVSRDFTPLELLADRLRKAPSADPEIFSAVIEACGRVAALKTAGKTVRLGQLLASAAWTDAAFALIALELPAWTIRRLVYEDGEWICTLSQQPNLPLEIDDTVDTHHPALPLAILSALIEARTKKADGAQTDPFRVPQVGHATDQVTDHVFCCDNFA